MLAMNPSVGDRRADSLFVRVVALVEIRRAPEVWEGPPHVRMTRVHLAGGVTLEDVVDRPPSSGGS